MEFRKRLDFLQAKEWLLVCFFRPLISGTFYRFIPCNLSRLSQGWIGHARGSMQGLLTKKHLGCIAQVSSEHQQNTMEVLSKPQGHIKAVSRTTKVSWYHHKLATL